MRLKKRAAVVTRFPTIGYKDIVVSLSLAGMSLESGEACVAEASSDDGRTWNRIFAIGPAQADGLTLHRGSGTAAGLDDSAGVLLRVAVRGNDDSDTCWFDDLKVSGGPKRHALPNAARITFAELEKPPAASLRHFSTFAPQPNALRPSQRLEGTVTLAMAPDTLFRAHRDVFGDAALNNGAARELPRFAFDFVQDGDRIVPSVRGPIIGTHAKWEWILEPGRAWQEVGDQGGYTRAFIPFALQERNANCTHYGALTFAFKSDGAATNALYQIAGETCAYFKFDLAGAARVIFAPGKATQAAAVVAAHRAEVVARLKTKPLSALAGDFPGADPTQFGARTEIDPDDMTAFGFVIDGTHYVGGCDTRAGLYPDCDVLPLPSYSTAKSIFAGLASMRLEMLHPGALQATVGSLVPQCSTARWGDVRLVDALNMATGNLVSTELEADERSNAMTPFFRADTHAERIAAACGMFPRNAKPGTTFSYHTIDTYILGTALNAFWRGKRGASAELYRDVLVEPLWRPLGLSPDIFSAKRTYDGERQPFVGYGLTYHRDDIARVATFLNDKVGVLNGVPVAHPEMMRAALQKDPTDRGLVANGPKFRYRHGFWAWDATDYLKCSKETWIPFMSGYGGISVVLMPNNSVYYYFSDGDVYAWGKAAAESNRIRKFC